MDAFIISLLFDICLSFVILAGVFAIILAVMCSSGRADEKPTGVKALPGDLGARTEQLGNVRKIGLIYCFEKNEDGPGENPLFNDKVVIVIGITPDAERAWPGNQHMAEYVHNQNGRLLSYGILSFRAYAELQKYPPPHSSVTIATEFPSLNAAKRAFQLAVDAGVGDIYLYENGECRDKLD